MLKSYVFGVLSAFLIAVMCLLLLTFVCVGGEDPRAFTGLFGVAVFMLGGIGGALVSLFLSREGHITVSLCTALTYALIVLTLSFYNRGEDSRPLWQTMLICLVMVGVTFGIGVAFAKRTGSTQSTRKKLHKRIFKR